MQSCQDLTCTYPRHDVFNLVLRRCKTNVLSLMPYQYNTPDMSCYILIMQVNHKMFRQDSGNRLFGCTTFFGLQKVHAVLSGFNLYIKILQDTVLALRFRIVRPKANSVDPDQMPQNAVPNHNSHSWTSSSCCEMALIKFITLVKALFSIQKY